MDEKEIIISIIENEFNNLSINNLINELRKIPQYDFKSTRTFILKIIRDIDTSLKNTKNKINKYFQDLKSQNALIMKKVYFQSRNKPFISKYNTKDSSDLSYMKENTFYQTQTITNKYKNYDKIESIKNLKSSDENSVKEYDDIFSKDVIEMKSLSGNNGINGNPLKFKKKINLGNKSLSEFKIKKKKKINLIDFNKEQKKEKYNLYKLYNQTFQFNDKNKKNTATINYNNCIKSNSIQNNKKEIGLTIIANKNNKKKKNNKNLMINYNNKRENEYYSNIKLIKQLNNTKKKISSQEKTNSINNNTINNNKNNKEKTQNLILNHNFDSINNNLSNYTNKIIQDMQRKNYGKSDKIEQEKNSFQNINKNNCNNTIIENHNHLFFENINNNNSIIGNICSIDNNCQKLAKEIINFLDSMKELQKNIINKNPKIKEMKYDFEKKKNLLYQKCSKLTKTSNYESLKNNKNFEISKTFSIFYEKTIDKPTNKDNSTDLEKTKEFNLSIANLRKTIEDIKNNSQFLTEQLKSEIIVLNSKLKEKNEKEKENEQYLIQNLNSIRQIYKLLLHHCLKQYDYLSSIDNDSQFSSNSDEEKFNWYINEISKFIDILINKNNNLKNDTSNNNNIPNNINDKNKKEEIKIDNKNNNDEIKKELLKIIVEIITWISPYILSIEKDKDKKNIIKQIETQFEQNKIKEALGLFKSEIKEVITFIENLKTQIKTSEKNKIKNINNKNKNNHLFEEEDVDNMNDKNNFLQLNSTLLGIQNDLIQKIENKQEEIEKIKKDLKNSIQLNNEFMNMAKNQKGQDVNIFAEKYKYLLDLFNSEQEKVKILQNEYVTLLNGLSNYVNNGDEIIIELKKMWNLNPIIKTNFEIAEPEFPEIDPINETDLLSEKS